MWRFVADSVDGTSHRRQGVICQDSHQVTSLRVDHGEFLISACSDGAGSAKESHIGSKLAVEQVSRLVTEYLQAGHSFSHMTPEHVRSWLKDVRGELCREAERRSLAPRDLACTLLMAVVGPESSAFLQIGDGAIVVLKDGEYRPVFWPQSGEYQNETRFVTDTDAEQNGLTEVAARGFEEVAVLTDGLQMLALNYADKKGHQPFFAPIFKAVREADDQAELAGPLRQFLESTPVNARTDDDKTLVLAVRCSSGGDNSL